MIVKFHARGRGGGSGPVGYLLGKERNREGASVLQGKPEEVRELIDASPYAKKYTSGVLSFAEADLPPGQREKLMEGFERVLMPGLDKDQYSILWVEHWDKGRLELNFLIPNTELLTGKRLQPYFDKADRPRIDAWQTLVNARLGLHDPNAPENRRTLVTPNTLPKTKQEAAEAITDGLVRLCVAGELKTRQDVIQALTASGFDVVRTTKTSISLADPEGGRNLRLRGAIYEQSFENGDGLQAEIERAGERYRATAEARVRQARDVCQRGTELKRAENQRRHSRPEPGTERGAEAPQQRYDRGHAVTPGERDAPGNAPVAVGAHDLAAAGRDVRERAVVAELENSVEPGRNRGAERHAGEAEREDVGRGVPGGDERALSGAAQRDGSGHELDHRQAPGGKAGEGVTEHDRAGNAVAERLRAAAAGLFAKAGRVGERLRGIADDVWSYATGQREAERSREQLESAGAELKRAGETFEPVVTRHEYEAAAAHARVAHEQRQKEQTKEREYPGPSLEL